MEGLCSACLSTGRKLSPIHETGYSNIYSQILNEICARDVLVRVRVCVCWECVCALRRWAAFRRRVQRSAELILRSDVKDELVPPRSQSTLRTSQIYSFCLPTVIQCSLDHVKTELKCSETEEYNHAGNGLFDFNASTVDAAIKSEYVYTSEDEMPLTFVHELRVPHAHTHAHTHEHTHAHDAAEDAGGGGGKKAKKLKTKVKKNKVKKRNKIKKGTNALADLDDHVESEIFTDIDALDEHAMDAATDIATENVGIATENSGIATENSGIATENGDIATENHNIATVNGDIATKDVAKEAKYECHECGKKFVRKKHYQNHLEKHNKDESEQKGSQAAVKPFCNKCNKHFSSQKTFKYHVNVLHGGENRHECAECGRVYQWRSNLARHVRTHKAVAAGELHCALCDKSFASVATFRTHLALSRRHVAPDDMRFVCGHCGVKFVSKTRLRDHVDWDHLNHIKFRCQTCNKPFKSHTSLYIHVNNVHRHRGRRDLLCHVCGKAYQNVCKLRSHVAARHGAAPAHRCGRCGAAFSWHSSWSRHQRHCKPKSPSKKTSKKPTDKETDTDTPTHAHQPTF